jgi:hypothetical protein
MQETINFINGFGALDIVNGQSGLVIPVPISNTEVKQACVLVCTALRAGNLVRCSHFLFSDNCSIMDNLDGMILQSREACTQLSSCRFF